METRAENTIYGRAKASAFAAFALFAAAFFAAGIATGFAAEGKISVKTDLDRSNIYVGDQINLTVTLEAKEKFDAQIADGKLTLGEMELIEDGKAEEAVPGGYKVVFKYRLATFKPDAKEVPKLNFLCKTASGEDETVSSDAQPLKMKSILEEEAIKAHFDKKAKEEEDKNKKTGPTVTQNPKGLPSLDDVDKQFDKNSQGPGAAQGAPQGEKIEIQLAPRESKPPVPMFLKSYVVLYGLLALLAVLVIFYVLSRLKERAKERRDNVVKAPPVPAHIIAYRRLEKLKADNLVFKRKYREYHFALSEIAREYIENRWGFPAREYTTDEITAFIRRNYPQGLDERIVSDILAPCDMVKFASFSPSQEEADKLLALAYMLVERTKKEENGYSPLPKEGSK